MFVNLAEICWTFHLLISVAGGRLALFWKNGSDIAEMPKFSTSASKLRSGGVVRLQQALAEEVEGKRSSNSEIERDKGSWSRKPSSSAALVGCLSYGDDDAAVRALCVDGKLEGALHALSRMDQAGTAPSKETYLSLLRACNKHKDPAHATRVHAHLAQHRPDLTPALAPFLVATLAKCGALDDARLLLYSLLHRTGSSWTALISAYAQYGRPQEALKSYHSMRQDGFESDIPTFLILFKACGTIHDLEEGKKLHADARRKGFTSNAFVASSLLSMYGKCGSILWAENVFRGLPNSKRDVVFWNAMLSAYAEQGQDQKALQLYRQMQEEDLSPDHVTYAITLRACCTLAEREEAANINRQETKLMSLEIGQAIHADAQRNGFALHVMVGSSLASLYGKCGTITEAENAFNSLWQRNVVSWTAMISAYVEQGQGNKALKLYVQMLKEGVHPDQQTFAIVLQACVSFAEKEEATLVGGQETKVVSLKMGQSLHADAERKGFTSNVVVCSTLVNMYAKCGTFLKAESVFNGLSQRDTVAWTAMFSAYVEHGQGDKALKLYKRMQKLGVALDDATLACVLQACSETGRLDVCRQLHFGTVSAGYESSHVLGNCLIHAYGTCSSRADAWAVFDNLSRPDLVSWNACISGYAREGDYGACLQMLENMQVAGTKPNGITFLSVLAVCSHSGFVDKGAEWFESMSRDHGIFPERKHYAIIMDLLGRAGDFEKVKDVMRKVPMQANPYTWSYLLGACRKHGNLELGKQVFDYAVQLQPMDYVLLSNIYADASLQECVNKEWTVRQKGGGCGGSLARA